ncbi:MAG TPA: HypC/HybG/HupF family hydrogenase formation chaperone [Deltaproteobacteria bacterium]|jgi:hydrogenase expression/formation protein HypC|nr:HypC/HybG/HupF family hydrogenase formation chaperone [Deltaproteobacteria bacterium]HOI08633.1 HypC/HybG/HupF family hydrogenase formation chaperone [Deltaproteobacteria bacterium]
MCIGFPGKILSIDGMNQAVIDIGGTRREVSLDIMDEPVAIGDYVITHAGFAIHKVDEDYARESLELLKELLHKDPTLLEP